MTIVAVEIDNQRLPIYERINTSTCYKAFMNYCIEHYPARIRTSALLRQHFKFDRLDPEFGRAIEYKRIVGINQIFYSTHYDTKSKIRHMKEIADIIGFHLILISDQD